MPKKPDDPCHLEEHCWHPFGNNGFKCCSCPATQDKEGKLGAIQLPKTMTELWEMSQPTEQNEDDEEDEW